MARGALNMIDLAATLCGFLCSSVKSGKQTVNGTARLQITSMTEVRVIKQ